PAPSLHGVRSLAKNAIVITLAADLARERTANVVGGLQPRDQCAEIMTRLPAEFGARPVVDVNAIDARNHRPAAPRIHGFIVRHVTADDPWRVVAQFRRVVAQEWRGGADDVFREPGRWRTMGCQQMRAGHIFD